MQPIENIRRLPQAESASGNDRVLVWCPDRQRTITARLDLVRAGIADSVQWSAVEDKPATATRWPSVAEVDGLTAALGDKLDAANRYTDAEAVAAAQAAPEWHAADWDAAYGWGDHALAGYLTSVSWGDVGGKPAFATVATSGAYADLSGTPNPANYATAAQGDKADSAVQPSDIGTAAAEDADAFDAAGSAQSAQDYAVQRENHTGTQTLDTISDAGTAAATDADEYDPAGSAARAEARMRDTIRRTPDPLLMMMLS